MRAAALADRCGPKRRAGAMARTVIPCRKSETRLSLPHEQSCASQWPRLRAPVPGLRRPGSDAKKFLALFPHNPLISHVSDERIQGNPRKSNGQNWGFSYRDCHRPRESKSTGSASSSPLTRAPTYRHSGTVKFTSPGPSASKEWSRRPSRKPCPSDRRSPPAGGPTAH